MYIYLSFFLFIHLKSRPTSNFTMGEVMSWTAQRKFKKKTESPPLLAFLHFGRITEVENRRQIPCLPFIPRVPTPYGWIQDAGEEAVVSSGVGERGGGLARHIRYQRANQGLIGGRWFGMLLVTFPPKEKEMKRKERKEKECGLTAF
jgi:hypothetical protein